MKAAQIHCIDINLHEIQRRKTMTIVKSILFTSFLFALSFTQDDIRKPPSVTRGPQKQIVYRIDDSITLVCKGEGVPAVTYEWKKNGYALNQNLPNIHKGADGTIIIQPATSMDEGFYQCFASNQYAVALSNTAHVQRGFLDFTTENSTVLSITVQDGMPFHIQAHPRGSFPNPTYGWEVASDTMDKNPISLQPSKRIQIAENGDLYFAYAIPEDDLAGKLYRSLTYNHILDVKEGGNYTNLTVIRNATNISQFAPTLAFSSQAETVAVIQGSVTLRCFFSGYPEPSISWRGQRNALPIGRYTLNPFNTELTIKHITASDEGDYVCAASNTQGRNEHTLQIRVEAVPSFPTVRDGPYNVNVTEGNSFTFKCNPKATPEAKIVWLRDGRELDPNNLPVRFVLSTDMKSLTIRDVCRDCEDRQSHTDLTVIQCNASNVHGYALASGYLNVLQKTKVKVDCERNVVVKANTDKRIQFVCSATSDPSTPPSVLWYKVENNEEQPVHEDPPTVTIKDGTLTIFVNPDGSRKWTKYHGEYRCIGDNGYSRDSVSANITVVEKMPTDARENPKSWWWIYVLLIVACLVALLFGFVIGFISAQRKMKKTLAARGISQPMEAKRYDYVRASEIGPFRPDYPTGNES